MPDVAECATEAGELLNKQTVRAMSTYEAFTGRDDAAKAAKCRDILMIASGILKLLWCCEDETAAISCVLALQALTRGEAHLAFDESIEPSPADFAGKLVALWAAAPDHEITDEHLVTLVNTQNAARVVAEAGA